MVEGMLANDSALGITNNFLKSALGLTDGASREFRKERRRLTDAPTRIHGNDQTVAVRRERFVELAFEVLNALVEPVNFLNGPWRFEFKTGIRVRRGNPAKGCDDCHL